jgi:tetratricopeptide (TPR) repeat protein
MYDESREEVFDAIAERRFEDAVDQLADHLEDEPDDAAAFALRAVCLAELRRWDEAIRSAFHAVRLEPELPYAHWALGVVLAERQDYRAALPPAREAVRLEPEDAEHHVLVSRIEAALGNWEQGLAAADAALRADPAHSGAMRLRGLILQRRGDVEGADSAFLNALIQNPGDAFAYTGRGWSLLHGQGDAREALEHFQEALRLRPDSEWAREGRVTAMKARNPLYRLMLRYFRWMASLSPQARMAIIVGGVLGFNVLRKVARAEPSLAPVIWPVLVAYVVFLVLSWTADVLFDSLLRLTAEGRAALTPDRVQASNWVLAALAAAGSLAVASRLVEPPPDLLTGALVFGFLVLPLSGTFQCHPGWPRNTMVGLCASAALLGVVAITLPESRGGGVAAGLALVLIVVAAWLQRWLASVTPRVG